MILKAYVLAYIVNSVLANCVLDHSTRSYDYQRKLKDDLNCKRRVIKAPSSWFNNITIPVRINFNIRSFSFNDEENIFTIYTYTHIAWKDDRLKWDPKDYGGIEKTIGGGFDIWTPSFSIVDDIIPDDFDPVYYDYRSNCEIQFNGEVNCIPWTSLATTCFSDLRNWPFDTQNCTFKLTTEENISAKKLFKFDATVKKPLRFTLGAGYGTVWDVTDEGHETSEENLSFWVLVERHAESYAVSIMIPSMVVSSLSMLAAVLDPGDIRSGIAAFGLLNHFTFLSVINEELPHYSKDFPLILIFVRISMIFAALNLLVGLAMEYFVKKSRAPYKFVVTINEYVYDSYLKYAVVLRLESEFSADEDITKINVEWAKFLSIVNSLNFYILLISYSILITAYMPKPPP